MACVINLKPEDTTDISCSESIFNYNEMILQKDKKLVTSLMLETVFTMHTLLTLFKAELTSFGLQNLLTSSHQSI
jgi:hypothetical protein